MSELSVLIGVLMKADKKPERKDGAYISKKNGKDYSRLSSVNDDRHEQMKSDVKKVMRHYVMSTRDIAARLKRDRGSVCITMITLRDMGLAEVVGETVHAGDNSKQNVWRLLY